MGKTIYGLLILTYGATAAAALNNRVAVLDFQNYGQATVEQGTDVADNVRLVFHAAGKYQVEGYTRTQKAVRAALAAGLDLAASNDICRVGKALGTDIVVAGAVNYANGKYEVVVTITEVPDKKTAATYTGEGEDLRTVTENVIRKMSGAERFAVLFPDQIRTIPLADEKTARAALALIATPEELALYDLLSPRGRSMMLDKFWTRRDPNPETAENEYEIEFWRRVEYVQQHFTTPLHNGIFTDRGKVYVIYGPPDEVEDHSGGVGSIVGDESSTWSSIPYYAWKYYGAQGRGGRQMLFVFTDRDGDGEFIAFASTEPGYGLTIKKFEEFDLNRLEVDAGDVGDTTETTFWDIEGRSKNR